MPTGACAWTVLDTAFGCGSTFLGIRHQWRNLSQRPTMLHYVGVLDTTAGVAWPAELLDRCAHLGPGFHRVLLDAGQVSLTLCVGPLQAMLAEQAMQADLVFLGGAAHRWDKWAVKALARLCRRGTGIVIHTPGPWPKEALEDAGFQARAQGSGALAPDYCFDPRWTLSHTRKAPTSQAVPGHCAVIGAGLAGASVAHALALRGWQVTVLDQHGSPAGGASGLPVGLVVPHVSADDSPRSRMSRSGTRLMLHHARSLLTQDQDWAPSGVLEKRAPGERDLWHPEAGWIQPAHMVRAWLQHPAIRFVGHAQVLQIAQRGAQWVLRDACHGELVAAEHVVFANALGCAALLLGLEAHTPLPDDMPRKLRALQAVQGLVSHGQMPPPADAATQGFPPVPVNGHGSFVPGVPVGTEKRWFAGATFETDGACPTDPWPGHQANYERLCTLLPKVGSALADSFAQRDVQAWSGTRCVTHDRLPLVGPLQAAGPPALWISAGMGARGLSFSALCAELLVAQMGAEPLPIEASLVRSLHALRPLRKPRVA